MFVIKNIFLLFHWQTLCAKKKEKPKFLINPLLLSIFVAYQKSSKSILKLLAFALTMHLKLLSLKNY